MNSEHRPNWEEAGMLLEEALERYRDLKEYESMARSIDDLANYMPGRRPGEGLSDKTIRRYMKGNPIPHHRVELCAEWLHKKARRSQAWIADWLELTAYPRPGELLAQVCQAQGNLEQVYRCVTKVGLPDLRGRLWGDFLGREEEIKRAIRWANGQRIPIAVLGGFGGNGKTTIQLKLGESFVYGRNCLLRWPFEGVIWVSAVDYMLGLPNLLEILRKVVEIFEPPENPGELGSARPDWLKEQAERILRKRRVLILLDNFETVSPENQEEILEFFGLLAGESQMVISSRHRSDLGGMPYMLIPVEGLRPEHAKILIQNCLEVKALSSSDFKPDELDKLARITQNNPKAIIAVLGLVARGMPLSHLLNSITVGTPEADEVFYEVFDRAWEDILTEPEKAVLMTKSFFSQPVSAADLGQVAGVDPDEALQAIAKLQDMSFFEWPQPGDLRIRTHPLAQDFTRRILRKYPDFERLVEERWWSQFAPSVILKARRTSYIGLLADVDLDRDVTNVLERVEKHLKERSPYTFRAAEMFAGQKGLGTALRSWGRWDDLLPLANLALNFAIEDQHPILVGRCALRLINGVHRERNEFNIAERYVAKAVEFNVELHDQWLQAAIEDERAHIYRRQGYFKAAKQAYQNALKIYLELGQITDIAQAYSSLGGNTIDIAIVDLDTAVDSAGRKSEELLQAEDYFSKAEFYWDQIEDTDPARRFALVATRAWRGVIARVRGDMDEAHQLFDSCMGQFQSLSSIARLYRELALVEHLRGNKDLAHRHEDRGLDYQRQLGISQYLPPHNCYKIIERMKKEDLW